MIKGTSSAVGDTGILLCCVLWSLSFGCMKISLSSFGPFWLIVLRFAITALLLVCALPRRLGRLTNGDWKVGSIIGVTMAGALAAQAMGLRYTTTGKVAFLTAGYVALLPFLLWLWGRRPRGSDFLAAAVCTAGMIVLSWVPGLGFGLGELCGVAAAFFSAGQLLSIEMTMVARDPLNVSITQAVSGTVLVLPLALWFDHWPSVMPPPAVWFSLAYLAVGCTLVPFALQLWAQPLTTPTRASLIFSLESVFATFIGVFWFGETMTFRFVLGSGLVFVSLAVSIAWRRDGTPLDGTA